VTSVAVIGARGYVGRALVVALEGRAEIALTPVTRQEFSAAVAGSYDVVVNAAMPAARFRARNEPLWDFEATVGLTARIAYEWSYGKLVQISSVSARCQLDTVYGRHKRAAEQLCGADDLIVRLGPMYSDDLAKGVLIDMLENRPVFAAAASRYAFAPRDWAAAWVADHLDRSGIVEVGARDAIALGDVARETGAMVEFRGAIDDQEIPEPEPDFPPAADVLAFMAERRARA
jgi:dTDP-4-dehydrorhamnose reductase